MYTLFYYPGTGSFAPQVALEEAGADYELRFFDIKRPDHPTASQRSIHPLGWVPSLKLPDGTTIMESAAILMHIADSYPNSNLAPPPGTRARALYYQWIVFMANNIYGSYAHINHPDRFCDRRELFSEIADCARKKLQSQWRIVDTHVGHGTWLAGEEFSGADIYLYLLSTWDEDPARLLGNFPNVARVAEKVAKRHSVENARRLEREYSSQ